MTSTQLQIVIQAKDEFSRAFARVQGEVSAVGVRFSREFGLIQKAVGVATKGLAVFGAGVTAAGAYAIKSAADFEQTKIAMTTMIGSAQKAGDVLQEVSKFAAATPFEFPELAGSVKQLMAFGFATDDAIKTMKQLGDIAAGLNVPIGDLSYLMGTMRAQGRAFTVDINQFANRGLPIYAELAKVLKVNETQVRSLVEAGKVGFPEVSKAIENMTAEGGKFHGMMAAQATSFSGLMSTLKDNVGFALREIVGINLRGEVRENSVFDLSRKAAQRFVEWLDANKERIAAAAQQYISGAIEKGKEWIEQLGGAEGIKKKLEDVWSAISKILPVLASFTVFLADHGKEILVVLAGYELLKIAQVALPALFAASSLAVKGLTFAFGLLSTAAAPWIIGGAIVAGLVAGVIWVVKNWDTVKAKTKEIADAIGTFFGGMAERVKGAFTSMVDWIFTKLQPVVDRINRVISGYNRLPGTPNISEIRFRATGGPVMAGRPYMVGERGPEMFIPSTSGRIDNTPVSNSRTEMVFNFNFAGAFIGNKEQFMREIQQTINRKSELLAMGASSI